MRVFFILFGKELRHFFLSPMAYIVLALFMLVNGLSFYWAVQALQASHSAGSLVTWMFAPGWFYLSFFALFPLITMRLISEETRLGTLETLLTAPVRASQLVLSKYLAAVAFYIVLWLPSVANIALFQFVTGSAASIPVASFVGTYSIFLLLGLFYLSIGLFASALVRHQIVAAVLSLTLILVHFLIGKHALDLAGPSLMNVYELVSYFASAEHLRTFMDGIIDTRPIVYHLSLTVFFLALTHQALEFRRWKV